MFTLQTEEVHHMFRRITLPTLFFAAIAITQGAPGLAASQPSMVRLDQGFVVELQKNAILLRDGAGNIRDQTPVLLAPGDFWTSVDRASECRINGTGGVLPGMIVKRRADGAPKQVWIASAEMGRLGEGNPDWALCKTSNKAR